MQKKLATTKYVDDRNIVIHKAEDDGYIPLSQKIYDERLKGCKSVLITILKTGAFNLTFEITRLSQMVVVSGAYVFIDLDKTNGSLFASVGDVSNLSYVDIIIRN